MPSLEDRVRCPCDGGFPQFCPIHNPVARENLEHLVKERNRELEDYRAKLRRESDA